MAGAIFVFLFFLSPPPAAECTDKLSLAYEVNSYIRLSQKLEEVCQTFFDLKPGEWCFHQIQKLADQWQKSLGK